MRTNLINFVPPESMQNSLADKDFKICLKNIKNEDDDTAEIGIYGTIGDSYWDEKSVGASKVADFLKNHKGKKINVRINSPGGLVWDGITIHNALVQHDAKVTTIIEGVAASAATIIAVAGDTAQMFDNATFFIHRAWGIAVGNVDGMQEMMEVLNEADQAIAKTLAAKTGKRKDTMLNFMKGKGKQDGTSFNADDALANGFIDEILKLRPKDDSSNLLKEQLRNSNEKDLIAARMRALSMDDVLIGGSV